MLFAYLALLLSACLFVEKHLDFEVSDDCYSTSTDASSLWSCDSGVPAFSVAPTATDGISLNSSDFTDSAVCSPQSLSLDRKLSDCLKLSMAEAESSCTNNTESVGEELSPTDADDITLQEHAEPNRGRTGTLLAPT